MKLIKSYHIEYKIFEELERERDRERVGGVGGRKVVGELLYILSPSRTD